MRWESLLVWLALAAFLASLAAQMAGPRANPRTRRLAGGGFRAGVLLLAGSLALLLLYFLQVNLAIEYVYSYTNREYPWYYRLAGLWGGQKGTLLMWAVFLGAAAWWMDARTRRAVPHAPDPARAQAARRHIHLVLTGLLAAFTGILLIAKVFEATPDYMLLLRPDGNGLQPVLQTPFMIIHPPLQFVAYALTGLLWAGGLVNVATGNRSWAAIIRPWTRLAWVVATLGLGLGGLWAYYVLNFGGFWAWDPVETANLIAWFPLTLLLHSLLYYDKGRFLTAAPLFALITFPAALFSTVATRTGLWVSVHAFTDPSKNFARDPFQRLLFILETSTLLQVLTAAFFASLLIGLAAVALGRVRNWSEPRRTRARQAVVGGASMLLMALFVATIPALSTLFQTAYAVTVGQSTLLGFVGIVGAVATWAAMGPPLAPEDRRPRSPRGLLPWVNARNVFAVGVFALTFAFLVVFLLDMMAVNGFNRQPFDDRAPFVALPILLALGTLFLLPLLGVRRGAAAAVGALGVGIAAAMAFPAHWEVALVAPALAFAAAGAFWRMVKASRKATTASKWGLGAGLLLMVGGIVGLVFWSNPPSSLVTPWGRMPLGWGWAVPGWMASAGAFFLGAAARGRDDARLVRLGGLLLVFAYGFGVSVAIGILAWVASYRLGAPGGSRAEWFSGRRQALRRTLVYSLHLMLILGLLGYALATYEAEESDVFLAEASSPAAWNGNEFQVVSSEFDGVDPVDGSPERILTRLRITDGERVVGEPTLTYWHVHDNTPGHYDAKVSVVRLYDQDVYVYPARLVFADGGELTDHSKYATVPPGPVTGVEMTVKTLPGVSLVWTGLWGLTAAMLGILSLGGFQVAWPTAGRRVPANADSDWSGETVGPRPAAPDGTPGAAADPATAAAPLDSSVKGPESPRGPSR